MSPLYFPSLSPQLFQRDAPPTGTVRASLKARGVMVVDFQTPPPPTDLASEGEEKDRLMKKAKATIAPEKAAAGSAAAAAAASAVSRELYRRGMLSAAWEVGPGLAAVAMQGGHIQRALVRRRARPLRQVGAGLGGGETPAAAGGAGVGHVPQGSKNPGGQCAARDRVEEGEEEEEVLRVLRRLAGSDEAVRLRRVDTFYPWGAPRESCIEVLLPAAETLHGEPPASA